MNHQSNYPTPADDARDLRRGFALFASLLCLLWLLTAVQNSIPVGADAAISIALDDRVIHATNADVSQALTALAFIYTALFAAGALVLIVACRLKARRT